MSSAQRKTQTVNDGFVRGTEAGGTVQIGTSLKLKVDMVIEAKTVSDVYKEVSKYKQDYSENSWKRIEKAHAEGSINFFWELLGISAGGSYDYENQSQEQHIKNNVESQHTAQALHDADTSKVKISGTIDAKGVSYVATTAYAFVHLTQITQDGKTTFTAVANSPDGKAGGSDGSQADVSGDNKLHTMTLDKGTQALAAAAFEVKYIRPPAAARK